MPLEEILLGKAFGELLRDALRRLKPQSDTKGRQVLVDTGGVVDAVRNHLRFVQTWSEHVSFRDLRKIKRLTDVYVDLSLEVARLGPGNPYPDRSGRMSTSDMMKTAGHKVLLGDAGAGKTTTLQRLAQIVLPTEDVPAIDYVPVFIALRGLADGEELNTHLINQLGIQLRFDEEVDETFLRAVVDRTAVKLLDGIRALLLLDGLDEVDYSTQTKVVRDLRYLLLHSSNSTVILTCRSGEYVYNLENAEEFRILPLSTEQIRTVSRAWLGRKADKFIEAIGRTPYAGTEVRPLTLAHLLAIFEYTGTIPEKPKTVYRKFVSLLISEWDEQRSIQRSSRFAGFQADEKEDFLKALAFELTMLGSRGRFEHSQLQAAYYRIHRSFQLPRNECDHVIREVEAQTGLLTTAGHSAYEFFHKSLQEYLTASYLLGRPALDRDVVGVLPAEMALLVSLSSDPTEHVRRVLELMEGAEQDTLRLFAATFFDRLRVEKVVLVDPKPQTMWEILWICHKCLALTGGDPSYRRRYRPPHQQTTDDIADDVRGSTITAFLETNPDLMTVGRKLLQNTKTRELEGTVVSVAFDPRNRTAVSYPMDKALSSNQWCIYGDQAVIRLLG